MAERQIIPFTDPKKPRPLDNGGGPPHNEDMDTRLTKLETQFETTIPTLATKSDLADLRSEMHKGFSEMVKWIVGTAIVMGATGITIIAFVLNNATPKATAAPQVQAPPVIINIPAPTAPAALAPKK